MNDFGTLSVFALALILLTVLVSRMNWESLALLGALVFVFITCSKRMHSSDIDDTSLSQNGELSGMDGSGESSVAAAEPNTMTKETGDPATWASIDNDQRPAAPEWSAQNHDTLMKIKKSNKLAVGEVFGRRYGGTMDNALYKHKQRIGDRDRQATINQIRARRNNVYEPYYRQELAEAERSRGWWNNDDILTTKLDHHQLATIDMGRFNMPESDMDGIYTT